MYKLPDDNNPFKIRVLIYEDFSETRPIQSVEFPLIDYESVEAIAELLLDTLAGDAQDG